MGVLGYAECILLGIHMMNLNGIFKMLEWGLKSRNILSPLFSRISAGLILENHLLLAHLLHGTNLTSSLTVCGVWRFKVVEKCYLVASLHQIILLRMEFEHGDAASPPCDGKV